MPPEYFFGRNPLRTGKGTSSLFLFLDFDGTLVPIQKDPAACVLSPETRHELERLADSGDCRVAVLSGRSLADLKKRVPLKGICYGGNHGLQISGCGLDFVHPAAEETAGLIARVRRALGKEIRGMKGVWVENKGLTFSMHYRLADREESLAARKAFYRVVAADPEKDRLAVLRGKKVLELMPRISWDKGKAALFILDSLARGSMPAYVGDDLTDECAFSELKGRGVTVRVGRSKITAAEHYVRGQREVLQLLREVGGAAGPATRQICT